MRYILITGTNRGIGLELTRQYAQKADTHVIATARDPQAKDLQALVTQFPQQISTVPLDVTQADSIAQAVKQVQGITSKLDILILNAGVNPSDPQDIETISADTMRQVFEVNTLAPMMLTQAFLPLLRKAQGAKIIYTTSGMASLVDRTYGGDNAYCISKAGLNMLMRGAAAEFKRDGIIATALDPGWVKTDMGGPHAELTPDEAVRGIIRVIDGLTMSDSGDFLRWDGQHNEW
jgi:NAD(P)-dependent dehydrogenase (short-subunit alcohol dehydrogenase family)